MTGTLPDLPGRFYQYAARLVFMLIVAAMLCCAALVGFSMVSRALPYSVNVKPDDTEDVADKNQDDYPKMSSPPEDDAMIPGGSQIARSIDEDLKRYQVYNDAVGKLASTTFGAPMLQSQVTRSMLFEDDDDWKPTDRAPDPKPTALPREITLFNFS